MPKQLTRDEWEAVQHPFVSVTIKKKRGWYEQEWQALTHWIENNCHGWFYFDGHQTFVFERMQDVMHLKLWISDESIEKEKEKMVAETQ